MDIDVEIKVKVSCIVADNRVNTIVQETTTTLFPLYLILSLFRPFLLYLLRHYLHISEIRMMSAISIFLETKLPISRCWYITIFYICLWIIKQLFLMNDYDSSFKFLLYRTDNLLWIIINLLLNAVILHIIENLNFLIILSYPIDLWHFQLRLSNVVWWLQDSLILFDFNHSSSVVYI